MTVSHTLTGEVRMLTDGQLVEAESGERFDNVNPATEEVPGRCQTPRMRTYSAPSGRRIALTKAIGWLPT